MNIRSIPYIKILLPVLLLFIILISLFQCSKESKVYRVGVVCGLDYFENTIDGFKEKMRDLGYVEGKNITYDIQHSHTDMAVAKKIISKFINDDIDLILAFPTEDALVAKRLTKNTDISLIFTNSNIEGVELVNSIKEPGDNITGVRYPGPDLTVKRFEIFKEIVPTIKKIWIPYLKETLIIHAQLDALKSIAEYEGITIVDTPIKDEKELEQKVSEFRKDKSQKFDVILGIAEPLMVTPNMFKIIAEYAYENKIPIGGALMKVDEYESIFGVSTDNVSVGRQAATLADKIFKGTKAGSIPVVSAENFIQINYKEIRRNGLNASTGLLKQANEIIQ
jgi:putative ABC transport system substrate-binding protein